MCGIGITHGSLPYLLVNGHRGHEQVGKLHRVLHGGNSTDLGMYIVGMHSFAMYAVLACGLGCKLVFCVGVGFLKLHSGTFRSSRDI